MCTVCGCSGAEIEKPDAKSAKDHHHHHHDHHHHHHGEDGALDFGAGPAGVHVAGQSQARLIEIEQDILSKNDTIAARNRQRLAEAGVQAINLMSSPGSGKTTLLVETIKAMKDDLPVAVIEGDQQTSNDAARIRETGVPALQVNTGKGCHLDAEMIASALDHMELPVGGLLFIENVGNLVCPAGFDLGESRRVVLASITEGEDKPLKYPEMFASSDAVIVSKLDLLPHLSFDVDALIENARRINPELEVLRTSATGEPGLEAWSDWLRELQPLALAAAE